MVEFVKLINYIDFSSNAFMNVLDDVCTKTYFSSGPLYVDIRSARNTKLMEYHLQRAIEEIDQIGTQSVVVNTCRPWDNWRKANRGRAIKAPKYALADDSVSVDKRKLESVLDGIWIKLAAKFKGSMLFVNDSMLDSLDIEKVIVELVGKDFVSVPPKRFVILQDSNFLYERGIQDSIPDYLYLSVETQLKHKHII